MGSQNYLFKAPYPPSLGLQGLSADANRATYRRPQFAKVIRMQVEHRLPPLKLTQEENNIIIQKMRAAADKKERAPFMKEKRVNYPQRSTAFSDFKPLKKFQDTANNSIVKQMFELKEKSIKCNRIAYDYFIVSPDSFDF